MIFPCTGCGLCCQRISGVEALRDYDLGNGTCKYFSQAENNCTIYDSRPLECRVDEMYDKVYSSQYSRIEFYKMNAQICNAMQEEAKVDEEYRVLITATNSDNNFK